MPFSENNWAKGCRKSRPWPSSCPERKSAQPKTSAWLTPRDRHHLLPADGLPLAEPVAEQNARTAEHALCQNTRTACHQVKGAHLQGRRRSKTCTLLRISAQRAPKYPYSPPPPGGLPLAEPETQQNVRIAQNIRKLIPLYPYSSPPVGGPNCRATAPERYPHTSEHPHGLCPNIRIARRQLKGSHLQRPRPSNISV